MKKTIIFDMDSVLNNFLDRLLEWYNIDYQDTLTKDKIVTWNMDEIVKPECGKKIYNYFDVGAFYTGMEPMENSVSVMEDLSRDYDIWIASAAVEYPESLKAKVEWIKTYFPMIQRKKIILCGDKSIIGGCGDYMVDDGVHNLDTFKGQGVLFTEIHNLGETRYPRVNNWLEVRDYFAKEAN